MPPGCWSRRAPARPDFSTTSRSPSEQLDDAHDAQVQDPPRDGNPGRPALRRSVTIDEDLLDAADLLPGEQVAIVDITNGARLETYVIPGERGSGVIGINGAAAHLVHPGDLVILISYGVMDDTEAKSCVPTVVHVDGDNRIVELGGDPAAPAPGMPHQRRGDAVHR